MKIKPLDWLDIITWIETRLRWIRIEEQNKRYIALAEKLAKRFKVKYVFSIYYEEGYDPFITLEETPEVEKWLCSEERYKLIKIEWCINVIPGDIDGLMHDAKRFLSGDPDHVYATNITLMDIQLYEAGQTKKEN